ncbi:MAG: DUF1566 domain-containing protein [Deltaproteobacteria bacterium]|nr:DUF1566 domain-containing protein [Deltaproteobacteria bacterium]
MRIPFSLARMIFSMFVCSLPFLSPGVGASEGTGDPGRRWAICVGIGDYEDPEMVDLPAAGRDAVGLARALREQGGFDQVLVLTDDLDKKDPRFPSRGHLLRLFESYRKRIQAPDLLVFSFSGQGVTDGAGRAFLATADTRLSRLGQTALPLQAVLDFIQRSGARRSVVFLDASRQEVSKRGRALGGPLYPSRYLRRGLSGIFYGAKRGYFSQDDAGSGFGVFTSHLIEGLRGGADSRYGGNGDGVVSLAELGAYVKEAMVRMSLEGGVRQVPDIRILESGMARMMVSTVEPGEGRLAVRPPQAEGVRVPAEAPAVKQAGPPAEAVAARPPAKAAEPREEEGPAAVGAPAPSIAALGEKGRTGAEETAPEGEAAKVGEEIPALEEKPEAPEETTGKAVGEPPAMAAMEKEEKAEAPPVGPPALAPAPAVRPSQVEEPLPEAEAPKAEEPPQVASIPPQARWEPVSLRARPADLAPVDIRKALYTLNFYATCWSYNGDFCNPDGDFENRFRDNGDGTITDEATGLMWQKGGSPAPLTWEEAREFAAQQNREGFAGHADWRLPTVEELGSLMERSWQNHDLFIDPLFDKHQRIVWSTDSRGMDSAWKANFHMGFLIDFPMSSKDSVRLVRTAR